MSSRMANFKMPITEAAIRKFLLEKYINGYKIIFLIGSASAGFTKESFDNIKCLLECIFAKCDGKAVFIVNGDLLIEDIISIADVVKWAKAKGFIVATIQSDCAFCIPESSYYPPGDDAVCFVRTVYDMVDDKRVVQWGGKTSTGENCGPLEEALALIKEDNMSCELLCIGGGKFSVFEEEAYRNVGGCNTSILQTKNKNNTDSLVIPTIGVHNQCDYCPDLWHNHGNCQIRNDCGTKSECVECTHVVRFV